MAEIILIGIFVVNLLAYNDFKNYLEDKEKKDKEKENILRKGLM